MLPRENYLELVLLYLLIINIINFGLFAWDKQRARNGAWRIRERDLFLVAALGGSLGGWLGMYLFHHKTLHFKFRWGFPLIILLQLGFLCYFIKPSIFSLLF